METIFTDTVIYEMDHPSNLGMMLEPDGAATRTGQCGDTMVIFLRVQDGKIIQACFMTDGCGPTIACGSMVTKLAQNRFLQDALSITGHEVEHALGGLPDAHRHCAVLAAESLTAAAVQAIQDE